MKCLTNFRRDQQNKYNAWFITSSDQFMLRHPPVCHRWARDPGEPWCEIPVQGQEKMQWNVPALAVRQERRASSFFLHRLFCSDPQWTGRCPPTLGKAVCRVHTGQMLISSGNTLTDTSRNNVFIWVPSGQSSWHKVDHPKKWTCEVGQNESGKKEDWKRDEAQQVYHDRDWSPVRGNWYKS